MTTVPHQTDDLDLKAAVGAPVAAFTAVLLASILCTGAAGTIDTISSATGQSIPFFLGALLVTLGAFGGLTAGEVSLTIGTVGFTYVAIPFIFTALAAFILFKVHRYSELKKPYADSADRLVASACSGMVLLICCVTAWFIAAGLNPDSSRASLTSNVFILAAGSLALGTVASMFGRSSAHRSNPAWSFTLRYGLATGMPIAIVVCIVMTVSYDWGSSSWILIGNMAAAIWTTIHAGFVSWNFDLGAIGGPNESGTHLLIAAEPGVWSVVGLPLGALSIIFATIMWRRQCMSVSRWALPLAFACIALLCLAAGSWASGYLRVGADTSRLSAMVLFSPINVPLMGAIGWLIDWLARLGYRSSRGIQPHR